MKKLMFIAAGIGAMLFAADAAFARGNGSGRSGMGRSFNSKPSSVSKSGYCKPYCKPYCYGSPCYSWCPPCYNYCPPCYTSCHPPCIPCSQPFTVTIAGGSYSPPQPGGFSISQNLMPPGGVPGPGNVGPGTGDRDPAAGPDAGVAGPGHNGPGPGPAPVQVQMPGAR